MSRECNPRPVPKSPVIRQAIPLEPLYSMLHDAPLTAVQYLHDQLSSDAESNRHPDVVVNLGISRQKALEQVSLVIRERTDNS